ncbi:MAG: hypothetical protein QOJ75_2264 [Chloroflexota bacterium]|nr:hypothetical protein [Chloroflexota bacterium]
MHRRPLGRGRRLAALATPLIVLGCVLPWWRVGGTPGITAESGNGLAGTGILVFLVGIASLALVALPYAAGDRPIALDRWPAFAILTVAGWIGFAWRIAELLVIGAFQFNEAADVVSHGPGVWLAALGLVVLSRSVFEMAAEPAHR